MTTQKQKQAPKEPATETQKVDVTAEEQALLANARAIRDELQKPEEEKPQIEASLVPEQIQLTDERAQRELDLRVVNEQLMFARQALAAGKVNRLLGAAGMHDPGNTKHDKQWKQEIIEARQGVDFLIAMREAVGETGLPEPSQLEIATTEDVRELTNA